jgi:hypothetical protein
MLCRARHFLAPIDKRRCHWGGMPVDCRGEADRNSHGRNGLPLQNVSVSFGSEPAGPRQLEDDTNHERPVARPSL